MSKRSRSVVSDSSEDWTTPAKRLKDSEWIVPKNLNNEIELCSKLLNFLRSVRDEDDSCPCELFMRTPSRRSLPDYHDQITTPIDFTRIQQKLKTESYKKVQEFINDVKLVLTNALFFYEPSCKEYQAAMTLKTSFISHLQEFGFSVNSESPEPSLKMSISNVQLPSLKTTLNTSSEAAAPTTEGRSEKWIEEFQTSNDPMKIYVASVYCYHDSSGDFVAEVFHNLPSREEYPEYYKVISEPIDINTIRKNVQNGHYSGFKAVQDDLILMIKNAHYFNEPGSQLHRKASTLRKFIINKGSELWRKFQLGQSVSAGSDGEVDVVKVAPKGSYKKLEEARKRSIASSELDEPQSELSEDDLFSQDEGEDKQQLTLHIKKEQLAGKTPTHPLTNLLRMKRPPQLGKALQTVYRCLVTHTIEGRLVCEMFKKRPSAKVYPEYYMVIKRPIDLSEIRENIKSAKYSNLDALMTDIELLVNNATTFNEEDSIVYADALVLRKTAQEAIDKIFEKWPVQFPSAKAKRQALLSVASNVGESDTNTPADILALYRTVKEAKDVNGRLLWKSFEKFPSTSSEVKKTADLTVIHARIVDNEYSNVDELFDDLASLFDSCYNACRNDSNPFKDSIVLLRETVKKYQELKAAGKEANPHPTVQEIVQEIIMSIVSKTLSPADIPGSLRNISAVDQFSDPDDPDSTVQRRLSLPLIRQLAQAGRYSRLDQLQDDVLIVLRAGRAQYGSNVYNDSVAMERQWIRVRDEACQLLHSPALSHNQSVLEAELGSEKQAHENSKKADDNKEGVAAADAQEVVMVDKGNIEQLNESFYEGVKYNIGDTVYIKAPGRDPHIVLIEAIWEDKNTDIVWIDGCWYYRPVETFHLATRKFFEKEVFKSDFHSVAMLNRVQGKCAVLPVKDYIKYTVEGISDEDTFVCESRYSSKSKSFKKIKAWSPPGVPPTLVPRETPLSLGKVPSVFAPVEDEPMDTTEPDTTPTEQDVEHLTLAQAAKLKNLSISVSNAEPGSSYYEQFCIDNDYFRLGDFVYLRSDQELPFIARIDKMWTDKNDDPWIHGPWFIRPRDVSHLPTRIFLHNEVFQSNIQDTNPMRSICGRCSVVNLSDYTKKRITRHSEDDVFVTESRYNEAEKKIFKGKASKQQHQLSQSAIHDEVYTFPKEIIPIKAPSPKLGNKEYTPVYDKPVVTVDPQLVQKLLSTTAKLAMGNKVTASLSQALTPTTPKPAKAPPVVTTPFTCQWMGCGRSFNGLLELGTHLLTPGVHIQDISNVPKFCCWKGCNRNPESGKSFENLAKLTRHLREVHLIKISTSLLGLSPAPAAVITPSKPTSLPSSSIVTATITPPAKKPIMLTKFTQTVESKEPIKTIGDLVKQPVQRTATSVSDIFHPPPEDKRQAAHSALYTRYINGLKASSGVLSSYKSSAEVRTTAKPPASIKPSDWLGADVMSRARDTKTVVEAIWALRDHLWNDSVNIANQLEDQ